MKKEVFILSLAIAYFNFIVGQSFSVQDKYIKVNISLSEDSIVENATDVFLTIINVSDKPIFIYKGDVNQSNYVENNIIGVNISSDFITDPLFFPKYKMTLIQLNPKDTYIFKKAKATNISKIKELRYSLEYVVPNLIIDKKLRRKFDKLLRCKTKTVKLKHYWKYKDSYDTACSGFFII